MDKTTAFTVCVAAGLIAIGAYFALSAQNDGSAGHGNLTILDSDDKIVKGVVMTYEIRDSDGKGHANAKTVVTEVNGNNVKFTNTYGGLWKNDTSAELQTFSRSGFVFDYTDSSQIPEGVTVTKEENSYRINGAYTEAYDTDYMKFTFKNLIITTDGTDTVESVFGQVTSEYTYSMGEEFREKYTDVYAYRTKDSVLYADWKFEGSADYDTTKDRFFEECVIYTYSPELYKGATITESSGKLGNFNVKVYTVNGDVRNGELTEKYEDYKVYVYNGYIISVSGKIDGDMWKSDVVIKVNS